MRVLWLPAVLRKAGLTVFEYPGWEERGSDFGPLQGIVCHHTASGLSMTTRDDLRVLYVTGSETAAAPISQLYLARNGDWWVGASGRCNHVHYKKLRPESPLYPATNINLIGVEACNNGLGEPWSPEMLDSYQRGVAAVCGYMRWTERNAVAHREHQYEKNDPAGIDMDDFRAEVARLLSEGDGMAINDRVLLAPGNPDTADNKELQATLHARGHDLGTSGPDGNGVDGSYGNKTTTAVKAEQAAAGHTETGSLDVKLWRVLDAPPAPDPGPDPEPEPGEPVDYDRIRTIVREELNATQVAGRLMSGE